MRTFTIRTLALGALAVLAFASSAASQAPSPILNTLEVRKLVASAAPADNAKLSAHFNALADRSATQARRHTSMSQRFGANPTRNLASGMSAHCRRLAELDTESAATARELAAHHEKVAAGVPSAAPRDAARFHDGAGAPAPTEQELGVRAATAPTPADHLALEEYFLTLAKRYTADANDHVASAQAYRGTKFAQAAVHCDRLVSLSRDSAKEATAAAAMHRQLAGLGR